jgi:hypothetical protein
MTIAKKLAIPAAITTAAVGVPQAAMAAESTHARPTTTSATASPRRARAIDILDHPTLVHPDSDSKCISSLGGGCNGDGIFNIFFHIEGHSSYVAAMSTHGCYEENGAISAHVEIQYPDGKVLKNGKQIPIGSEGEAMCASLEVTLKKDMPTGDYKAILWSDDGGNYTDVISVTLPVYK